MPFHHSVDQLYKSVNSKKDRKPKTTTKQKDSEDF
jgi:hypothetical protein